MRLHHKNLLVCTRSSLVGIKSSAVIQNYSILLYNRVNANPRAQLSSMQAISRNSQGVQVYTMKFKLKTKGCHTYVPICYIWAVSYLVHLPLLFLLFWALCTHTHWNISTIFSILTLYKWDYVSNPCSPCFSVLWPVESWLGAWKKLVGGSITRDDFLCMWFLPDI